MEKKKIELNDDELDVVTGGRSVSGCPYFMVASGKWNHNKCENCFYYQQKNGKKACNSPLVKNSSQWV